MGISVGLALLGAGGSLMLYRITATVPAAAPVEQSRPVPATALTEPAPGPSPAPVPRRARRAPLAPGPRRGSTRHQAEMLERLRKERLELEEQQQALKRERISLRQQEQLERNLIARLRGTLAIIAGYADMLVSENLGEVIEAQRYPLQIIYRRARQLTAIIEDLETLLQANEPSLRKGQVDLSKLVEETLSDFEPRCRATRLTLKQHITLGTPPIYGHKEHLRRVLENLLDNAVKFTPEGGTITVSLTPEGNEILLQVSDTGIGIAEEAQSHIFERFYQVTEGQSRPTGSGLGLALVKEVVQAHGGTVQVSSQVGRGTTFTVRLPITPPAEGA